MRVYTERFYWRDTHKEYAHETRDQAYSETWCVASNLECEKLVDVDTYAYVSKDYARVRNNCSMRRFLITFRGKPRAEYLRVMFSTSLASRRVRQKP